MSRIVFLNGAFVPAERATIPVMDRGFLFADGIYEVSAVLDGRLIDNAAHLARLERSLGAVRIPNPYPADRWADLQAELVRRNGLAEGLVYIEVTRGVAESRLRLPARRPADGRDVQPGEGDHGPALAESGAAVTTVPDRWSGATSARSRRSPRCSPSRRRSRPASPRPGWSRTGRSPRAARRPPSSLLRRNGDHARAVARRCCRGDAPRGDAACRRARAHGRGAAVQCRGSRRGGRSFFTSASSSSCWSSRSTAGRSPTAGGVR